MDTTVFSQLDNLSPASSPSLLEAFKAYSESNLWGILWLEIALVILALGLLVLELMLPRHSHRYIPNVAIIGQIILLAVALGRVIELPADYGALEFSGMILQTPFTAVMQVFFLLSSLLVSYLACVYLSRQQLPRIEFFHITLMITAAFSLLVQSNHFVMFFVALETVTIGFYVLVGYCRNSSLSLEAGLKYLIMGGLSSAILLFGIVLLYGAAGNPELVRTATDGMQFTELGVFVASNASQPLVIAGVLLVIAGVAFKIGVVPFQIWIPDVYQGAPTPTTAFLAVSSKAAGFAVLINLLRGPFIGMEHILVPLLGGVAAVTILFGNITPLSQRNVKRIMGLSGVSHAGYLLAACVALMLGSNLAVNAIVFYLFTYLLGSFAVFAVMAHTASQKDDEQELEHYTDLAKNHPLLGCALIVGLGSLAGIPPLAGFIGKFLLFLSLYEAGLFYLLMISIVGVVISIYYYFGWMREAVFHIFRIAGATQPAVSPTERAHVLKPVGAYRVALILLILGTVTLGLFQGNIASSLFIYF